jgi:hypothetical protein
MSNADESGRGAARRGAARRLASLEVALNNLSEPGAHARAAASADGHRLLYRDAN